MRTFFVAAASALILFADFANGKELNLHDASVVIFFSKSKALSSQKENEEFDEALADFGYYAGKFKEATKGQRVFRVIDSSAEQIRFGHNERSPVKSSDLGGFGFIFYKPRVQPVVIEGVATDVDLVCEASKLFKMSVEGYHCGP